MSVGDLSKSAARAISPVRIPYASRDQVVTLAAIGWEGYRKMLRVRGDRPRPRLIYLDGHLTLMSPSQPHEEIADRIGYFIGEVVVGLRIPFKSLRSTTIRRKKKRGGVEGDLTFYIANEPRVRLNRKIDFRVEPPPDLAVEVVYSHAASKALEVYRRLGVPEVWIGNEWGLRFLARQADGRYAEVESSLAFPFLTSAEVFAWIQRSFDAPQLEWTTEVRAWVRDVLAPRLGKTAK